MESCFNLTGIWCRGRKRKFVSVQGPNQVLHGPFNKIGTSLIFGFGDLIDFLQKIVFQSHSDLSFRDHRIFGSNHFSFDSPRSSSFLFSSHKSPIFGGFIPQIHFKTFNLKCNLLNQRGNQKSGAWCVESRMKYMVFGIKNVVHGAWCTCDLSKRYIAHRISKSLSPLTVLHSEVQEVSILSRGRMIAHGFQWNR